jgi:hypothetical protein
MIESCKLVLKKGFSRWSLCRMLSFSRRTPISARWFWRIRPFTMSGEGYVLDHLSLTTFSSQSLLYFSL